jgi:tripartite-type tricarboxylate transporter receptor subunit TctC
VLASRLTIEMARTVIVENRPGAGGLIAARDVAIAGPSRDVVLLTTHNTISVNPHIYAKLGYNPEDLLPSVMVGTTSYLLIASRNSSLRSVTDVVAAVRKPAGSVRYGSYGLGSAPHLCTAMLLRDTEGSATHVPYRDTPLNDLVGGHIELAFAPIPNALKLVEAGEAVALGFSSAAPASAGRLGIPAVADTIEGFDCGSWVGFFVPKAAGDEIAAALRDPVEKVMTDPDVLARLSDLSISPVSMSNTQFRAFLERDSAKWKGVVQSSGLKIE